MKKSNPVGLFNIENGTSGMKKHLDAEHPEACKRFHLENPTIANRQSKLVLAPRNKWTEKEAQSATEALSLMIVGGKLSFNFILSPYFRHFVAIVQPAYTVPSNNSLVFLLNFIRSYCFEERKTKYR